MKKALLLFGFLCLIITVQSCTTDTDDLAPIKETYNNLSVTDTITAPIYSSQEDGSSGNPKNTGDTDNGDLTKDPEKKK